VSALLAAAAPPCGARAGDTSRLDEPFAIRSQLPLNLPFLEPPPRSAFLLPGGEGVFSLRLAYESTHAASDSLIDLYRQDDFATYGGRVTRPILERVAAGSDSDHAYYVDGETLRAVIDGRFGLGERFEIAVELPLLARAGGFLDAPIDSYHARLGLPYGGRDAFAHDQHVIGYSDAGRTVFQEAAPSGLRPGDLVLGGRATLARGAAGRSAIAASLAVKIPTASIDRLDGSGHADAAGGVQASWRLKRATMHAGYGYSRLGDWSLEPGLDLGDRQSLFFTWAFRATRASAVVLQILGGSGPFPRRGDGTLGRPAAELAAGMRHSCGSAWTFEWALLENLTRDLNVPDVGLFVGAARRFRWRKGAGGRSGPPEGVFPAPAHPPAGEPLPAGNPWQPRDLP
jgi:hypothetical protein